VPDSATVRVGFDAFDAMVTVPLALPADAGVNLTLKVALWPAVSVTGVVIPLRLNPLPLIEAWEIVTLAPPVFVTVSVRDWLFPTVILPKLRLVGFDPRAPGATPTPDSGTVSVEFEAFELIVMLPFALAADAGVKVTVNVAL